MLRLLRFIFPSLDSHIVALEKQRDGMKESRDMAWQHNEKLKRENRGLKGEITKNKEEIRILKRLTEKPITPK